MARLRSIAAGLLIALFYGTSFAQAAPVSLNVTNAEVRDVLTALAAVGGVNLVADDSVTGRITIQLQEVSFETALELVTKTKGLVYHTLGNVIVVGTPGQISRNFGTVHVFKLQYANPEEVREILQAMLFDGVNAAAVRQDKKPATDAGAKTGAAAKPRPNAGNAADNAMTAAGRMKVDTGTNALLFYGSEVEAGQIREILKNIDVPYRQVSLEAEVVAVDKNAAKELGVDWRWSALPQYPEYDAPEITPIYDSSGNLLRYDVTKPGKVIRDKQDMVGTIQFGKSPGGYPYEFYYSAQIRALISKGEAKLLAKPNITTLNGNKGHILIGDKIPVAKDTTENDKTTTTFEYQEAGIILDYVPRINDNGEITIELKTSVSSPVLIASLHAYQLTTREAATNVRLKDGETMVIGGLIGSQQSGGRSKVPFLGDLPLLGSLFQSVHTTQSETELMIFLTARIVK